MSGIREFSGSSQQSHERRHNIGKFPEFYRQGAHGRIDLVSQIVPVQWFRSKDSAENTIPYSTTDYLELVDWSGRAIVEGKKGFIPEQLPPILQRLNMRQEQYLAYVRKPKYGFANALGALDKLKACAGHFEKAFLKGQTAAAALFSPGR